MGSNKGVQLSGCIGKHGSYAFFKSMKIIGRTYTIASHFPVRIWPDSTILSLAEVQLLWTDRAEAFCSLKLYFLPENTPDGRHQRHGEDEVIALQDKVIIRASDLLTWLVDDADWDWGYMTPSTASSAPPATTLTKAFHSEKFLKNAKEKELLDFSEQQQGSSKVVVLNYERYIRLRTVLKRLEGSSELSNWLSHPLVLALGGLTVGPNCRLLFAKEVFDYPELEDHELLCNHLAPKLKGKPKRRRRRRNPSLGSESNESETSSTGSCGSDKVKRLVNGLVNTVKSERADELLSGKQAIENSSRFPGDLEEALKNESSSIKRIANKLISEVSRNMANGKIRNDNSTSRIHNSNHHYHGGDGSAGNSHSSLPVIFPHSLASKLKGDPENIEGMDVKLLGPALSELAQKLEKSNALQILPIRPSVIQKPEPSPDDSSESHHHHNHQSQSQGKKRLKTESSASSNIMSAEMNSNFRIPPPDMDFFSRNWNGHPGRAVQSIYGPPPPRQSSASKVSMNKNGHNSSNSKGELQQSPPVPSIIKVNHMPKVERPVLSITPVDMDGKKINSLIPSMRLSSPSPFVPTARIYGDPTVGRKQQAPQQQQQLHQLNNAHHRPAACDSGDILDFSVKRRRLDSEQQHQGISLKNQNQIQDSSELLDLSTKSQSSTSASSHGQNNKKIFHSLADIPPPNAMNQLGLRLTSEVTLFPSNPSAHGNVSGHGKGSSKDGGNVSKSHHNHNNHNHSQQSSSSSSKSSGNKWEGKQSGVGQGQPSSGSMYRPSRSSSSAGKLHGNLMSETNNHHQQLLAAAHESAYGLLKQQQQQQQQQHRSSKSHKNNDHPQQQQFPMPSSAKERLALPGHSHGTAAKPVATMSIERERERDAREKNREQRERDNSNHYNNQNQQSRNNQNHLGHRVLHPQFYPKMDPAYLHLFAPPMFMPPSGVSLPGMLGMAGMPPGAMEQLQLYQELIQKGLAPQFPAWPHESAKERGQK